MKKQKFKNKQEEINHEINYISFLKKQLDSNNYKKNISTEQYEKTEQKYKNSKFRLKILLSNSNK